MYQEIAAFRTNPEELITMFSEALAIMDRNTERYMVEEAHKEIEGLNQEKELLNKKNEGLTQENEQLSKKLEEVLRSNKELQDTLNALLAKEQGQETP
jgi:predicted nuclease with TOPRIM domain